MMRSLVSGLSELVDHNQEDRKHVAIHMPIPWKNLVFSEEAAVNAPLKEKTVLVGRIGYMLLAGGAGAWRVRDEMNRTAKALGIGCSEDIGLTTINFTCFDGGDACTYNLTLRSTGINTVKLWKMSDFVKNVGDEVDHKTVKELFADLDAIEKIPGNYTPFQQGLAAGFACMAFTWLLGGGFVEMLCVLVGACLGNFLRVCLLKKRFSLYACVSAGVGTACVVYIAMMSLLEMILGVSEVHEAGYICAMLFIIPGFPLITGGLDIFKMDMRSGLERTTYALMIIIIATLTGMVVAKLLNFEPGTLVSFHTDSFTRILLQLVMSFIGVFGFSLMYDSTFPMAAAAGCAGMIANTLRLQLVERFGMLAFVAAFFGAMCAGILGSIIKKKTGFPRISLTVPAIVIMVPGMFMYRGVYSICMGDMPTGGDWLVRAVLMVMALPLGLVFSRFLMEHKYRHDI